MSYAIQLRCDSPHCGTYREHEDTDTRPDVPEHWMTLQRAGHYSMHFCSIECLKNWIEHQPYVSKRQRKVGEPI